MSGRHSARFVESVNEWALIPSFNIATTHCMVLVSASFQALGISLEGTTVPPSPHGDRSTSHRGHSGCFSSKSGSPPLEQGVWHSLGRDGSVGFSPLSWLPGLGKVIPSLIGKFLMGKRSD